MDRRKILLIVAAVIAALGTLLVFLYVRSADNRADQRYDAVQVLRVVKQIPAGETVEAAQAAGKIETGSVSRQDLLPDALTGTESVAGKHATSTIYPGEQLTSSKFGDTAVTSGLGLPKGKIAISVSLSDPAASVAGFVNPGDKVAIFLSGENGASTRLLLPNIQVIGVGATTAAAAPAPADGAAAAPVPQTSQLMTLAVSQSEAERVIFASTHGRLAFGLMNTDSQIAPSGGVASSNLFQ